MTSNLEKRITDSVSCIKEAINIFGTDSIAISFNGGKDSTVLLNLLCHDFPLHVWPAIYVSSPDTFEEVNVFVQECEKRYSIKLVRYDGWSLKEGIASFLKDNMEIKAVLIECRRSDPGCMYLRQFQESDNGWPRMMRVMPLLDWEYYEIWDYIRKFSLPYCSLYDHGYTSIGSIKNTRPNPHLKSRGKEAAALLDDPTMERCGRLS